MKTKEILIIFVLAVLVGATGFGIWKVRKEEFVSPEIGWRTGTVKYIALEGGFYGIVTDKEKKLDPINLPQEFKKDGLKVKFKAKKKREAVGIHMWGTMVEITEIEALESEMR